MRLAIQYKRNLASKQVFLQSVSARKNTVLAARIGKNLVVQKFHLAMFSIVLCCLKNIPFCAYPLSAPTWYPFHLLQSEIFYNFAHE